MKKGMIIFGVLSFIFLLNFVSSNILINEFVVDPQNDWGGSGTVTTIDEWVELYNNGISDVNLSGWNLSLIDSSPGIEELSGTIMAGSYLTT